MFNSNDLQKAIDGIPMPDITMSSVSVQSSRTPQSKLHSLTNQQIEKIVQWSKSNVKNNGGLFPQVLAPSIEQNTVKNHKTFTLGSFKENAPELIQDNVMKHNSKLRKQLIDQQKMIETQMNQIASMNDKISSLSDENYALRSQMNEKDNKLSDLLNEKQKQSDELMIEIAVLRRNNQVQEKRIAEQTLQISEFKIEIETLSIQLTQARQHLVTQNILESSIQQLQHQNSVLEQQLTQIPKLQFDNILSSRQSELQELPSTRHQIDPELLSEDETLQMLLSLLTRVSRSIRMTKILKRHPDFRMLFKEKKSVPSITKQLSFIVSPKKLSFNQDHFKYIQSMRN